MTQKVNWVLDADIRKFFDSVDHEWVLRMLAHRIADKRVLRLIELWLHAGVLAGGVVHESTQGTPQGSGVSPLLANVFLHYVLDLWAHRWRRTQARDRVVMVRYCDDFVMGFQNAADAQRMLVELRQRLHQFNLALHDDKTRLIPFGLLDLRVPRLHPLRSVESGRALRGEAPHARIAGDSKAQGVADVGARTNARPYTQPARVAV
jgi:retron-type reverse transcriptase